MKILLFRLNLGWHMLLKFSILSDIKLITWFFCRKLSRKQNKSKIGSIYVKKLGHKVWIRPYCSDYGLVFDFFVKETHEKGGHYEFPQINSDQNINYIIDAGANIGLFSLVYATKFPNATIVALEPEDSNYKMLKLNSTYFKNIKPIKVGVWYRNAKLAIQNPETHTVGFTVNEIKEPNSCKQYIEGRSILYIMEKYNMPRIDVLKMDIEGSEFPVFCDDFCDKWLGKTRYLIMEIHDQHMENGRKVIYEKMGDNKFRHIDYSGDDFFFKEI